MTEDEFDAINDPDESRVVSYEDYLAEVRKMGIDPRQWDHKNYLRIASRSLSGPDTYVHRDTIKDVPRIERLRWRAHETYCVLLDRLQALADEVRAMPDQECFIPHDPEAFAKTRKEHEDRGETFTEHELWEYAQPRRVAVRDKFDDYVTYDDDFWREPDLPDHDEHVAMEVLAAHAELGDWDHFELPARIERAKDPAKLALGARWRHAKQREFAAIQRCWFMNQLLAIAVLNGDFLPEGDFIVEQKIRTHINGRVYYFSVGRGMKQALHDLWPRPTDPPDVVIESPAGAVTGSAL